MNFTREPIIETVITPREGCKLVVRSSKANGQEDYFVDAVEVVSFGRSLFFRSQERPQVLYGPCQRLRDPRTQRDPHGAQKCHHRPEHQNWRWP